MSQNQDNCSCNDYMLQAGHTGIINISSANTNLDGAGNLTVVLTGAENGTLIKSIIIKAAMPVTTGMVRLYVSPPAPNSTFVLFKEIPIPTTPSLNATPTPLPMLQTYEIKIDGGLKLESQYRMAASTQNAESFNVIVEGLDWEYPATLPASCCSYKQETAISGMAIISTANPNTDGTGTITAVFTAANTSTKGSVLRSLTIKALQSTNEGMIRLFISPNGSTWTLMKEIYIPQTIQSGFQPSFKVQLDDCYNLQPGYVIGASTQIGQSFGITTEGASWIYAIS